MESSELPYNMVTKKYLDRRDRLQGAGVEFLDPNAPHEILIQIDIPFFPVNQTFGEVCNAIGKGIKYRLALSHYKNAGCLPLHHNTRIQLLYHLNDLAGPEDLHTARIVHQRILKLLQERAHISIPFRLYVANRNWDDRRDALVIQPWDQMP